jgi:hypothetical protein
LDGQCVCTLCPCDAGLIEIGWLVATIRNEKAGLDMRYKQGRNSWIRKIGNSPVEGLRANGAEFVALFPPSAPGSVLQSYSIRDFVL